MLASPSKGRRRHGGQADLSGAVERQPGRDPARCISTNGWTRSPADFSTSCLMGTGQFCTNPGLVILLAGPQTDQVHRRLSRSSQPPRSARSSRSVAKSLAEGIATALTAGGRSARRRGTVWRRQGPQPREHAARASGQQFFAAPEACRPKRSATRRSWSCATISTEAGRGDRPSRRKPHRLHLLAHGRGGRQRRMRNRAGTAAARSAGCSTTRCRRCCRESGDEPRRAVSRDRPSGIHRGRHSRVAPPLRHAAMLRRRAAAPLAAGAGRQESDREAPGGWSTASGRQPT